MTINYTTLLGLAQPVPGTEANTWGTVVNDSITELVEDAIAGSATASVTSADWTLTTTGSGAANQARSAILIPTGTPGVSRNIIAPSSSKAYIVDNQSNAAVVIKGSATTGVSVAAGTAALVAWDGTDFVLVSQDLANASGTLPVTKGGTGATTLTGVVKGTGTSALTAGTVSLATEVTGTLPVANGGTGATTLTANNVILGNGTSAVQVVAPGTTGNVLTSNGTTWASTALPNVGDVDGPGSSTDNAIARFDGTTGKIIQNSAVTIADDGATVIAANSSSDALRITQVGSGNALLVEDSANPDANPFVIDASGNTGVGTTTPSAKFVVSGAGITSMIESVAGTGVFQFNRCNNTIAAPTAVTAGATLSQVKTFGHDGVAYIEAARIETVVDGTPGTNDMPGRLVFSTTADGASSPIERMRIDNAGNVGIGASPQAFEKFVLGGTLPSGSANTRANVIRATIPSQTTSLFNGFRTEVTTQAASFNLSELVHFSTTQSTIGAGSSVTNQYGFTASSTLTGATNNFGFFSNIASGTGRWNFYAAGSARNYFAGATSIGTTSDIGQLNVVGIGGCVVGASSTSSTDSILRVAEPLSTYLTNFKSVSIQYRGTAATGTTAGISNADLGFLSFTNTANALIQTNGAAPLIFAPNNAERMRIFASGGVSIGNTTDPGTTNLSVTGTISGGTVTGTVDGTNAIGFRTIPQNSQSAAYTLVLTDSGKQIFHPSADTTARTFTIPANASVAYPIGTAVTFINQNGAGVITIAITSDTMRLAGAGTTGSRTLAANGVATAIKVTATEWIISGTGLS